MKLSSVFLLFFFSCAILLVGAVGDISADAGVDGPYTAEAYAYRVNITNVKLSARASSYPRAKNGWYQLYVEIDIDLDRQVELWIDFDEKDNNDTHHGLIDGDFSEQLNKEIPLKEHGYGARSNVGGQLTNGDFCSANARETVGEIPILEPTPVPQPQVGISSVDPDATPYPGNTYEFRLITDVHYYWVDWYVKAPWETSERGTHIEGQLGDGETTESTFSYTFPSGAMHTGDFLITAVIYRGTDMSQYEETYTATVSLE